MTDAELDFRLLFEHSPDVLLVLLPDSPRYTMVAATNARLAATNTTRESLGKGLFEVFPDNPDDPSADGTRQLRASLDRALASRKPDTMAVQKYDIPGPDGTYETRYWSPKNVPLLGPDGQVKYLLHTVEDVSELVKTSELGDELRDRTRQMERDVLARSRELANANTDLRDANAKLGELDAAKTAFFSNVSHEFRTPLTLMLGPLDDVLSDREGALPAKQRARVEVARDNTLRLLKLVNALLDFSRLEAGRIHASFTPVDMGRFTAELAGMFQSATDRVGLRFVVDCPPLGEPAWIDRGMWEKIVPNLVSNAFKFTMKGQITVRVREERESFVLEVADTGTGIPAEELPKIFDRFHRVTGAVGRTHEGTGIGLSLVRELVKLHGGEVAVASKVGDGTTFRVTIPRGFAHLPEGSVVHAAGPGHDLVASREASAYAVEATRWVGRADSAAPPANGGTNGGSERSTEATGAASGRNAGPRRGGRASVLVVDDNADLRDYIFGLLSPHYDVTVASDGQEGLEAVRKNPPEIVVSDVMMPRLDGFGLVRELRADAETASLPIILLSARAGEEAAIEGLDVGADDYLMKPFSAPELLARVRTHVDLARVRRELIAELEHANRELDAFSYSVSHDLRAPLRAISGFAGALAEDHGDSLDASGKDHLERILKGVTKATKLIDDLLSLARIGRAALHVEEVNLSQLATSVVTELRQGQPERSAAVRIDVTPDMVVRGDRALLRVALVNLIGNAWKYSSRRESAHIKVGRHPADVAKDGEVAFFVQDDGAGFDMTYASRLFAPFQRLHGPAEFEGTGIGLATVRRVLSRHGGRVWAEAETGRGATFSFALPTPEPTASASS